MRSNEESSKSSRLLMSMGSILLIGGLIYILVSGLNLAVGLALLSGQGIIGGPVVAAGGGVGEMVSGFFEALLEGVIGIFSGIADAIGSIFG